MCDYFLLSGDIWDFLLIYDVLKFDSHSIGLIKTSHLIYWEDKGSKGYAYYLEME